MFYYLLRQVFLQIAGKIIIVIINELKTPNSINKDNALAKLPVFLIIKGIAPILNIQENYHMYQQWKNKYIYLQYAT